MSIQKLPNCQYPNSYSCLVVMRHARYNGCVQTSDTCLAVTQGHRKPDEREIALLLAACEYGDYLYEEAVMAEETRDRERLAQVEGAYNDSF